MAKQIKVLKCPQCGNTKPTTIGYDHYRCDKCGTEFFLDNDDINVNVNYTYGKPAEAKSSSDDLSILKKVALFIIILFIILGVLLISFITNRIKQTRKNYHNTTQTINQDQKNDKYPILFSAGGKAIVFYIEKRSNVFSSADNKNGYFAVFHDIVANKIIKEENLPIRKNIGDRIEHRHFISDNTDYLIINDEYIYKINPGNFTLKDIAGEIAKSKPALNEGFSAIHFVPEGQGEGFRLMTNLGKEFYFFPNADMLCTDRAFKHIAEGGFNTLSPVVHDTTYYLLRNKDSKQSSNVATLYKITYRYNNGGPESRLLAFTEGKTVNSDLHRIVSMDPITEARICFSPEILYFDDQNILMSYRTTLAKDALSKIELLDTAGNIQWTIPLKNHINGKYTVKTKQGYMIQTLYNTFYEINSNGKEINSYTLD